MCSCLTTSSATARVITVAVSGGDYGNSQLAINHASEGDTILVKQGTYSVSQSCDAPPQDFRGRS
jgi:hypothetical protein